MAKYSVCFFKRWLRRQGSECLTLGRYYDETLKNLPGFTK